MPTTREVLVNSIEMLNADIQAKAESVHQMQGHLNQLPPTILDLDHDAGSGAFRLVLADAEGERVWSSVAG